MSRQSKLTRARKIVFGIGLLAVLTPPVTAEDSEQKPMPVRGKWIRQVNTPEGRVTIIKNHTGKKTMLTAFAADRTVLYSHTSEYRLERSGRTQIFTFKNRTITAGPQKGDFDKKESSFLYQIRDDRFLEVHGMLDGDTGPPKVIIWQRVKPNAQPDETG